MQRNRDKILKSVILTALLLPQGIAARDQLSGAISPQEISPLSGGSLRRASEMIYNHNYTGALDQLRGIDASTLSDAERRDLLFLVAETAYRRGDADCVALLDRFASSWPASPQTLRARLLAADYFFFAGDYAAALERYEQIDFAGISASERPEYDYRKALSMIKRGYFDEARPIFASLRGSKRFGIAADYYTAYLDYVAGDYDAAYSGFAAIPVGEATTASRRASRDYVTDGLEPGYYMVQIDFLRGRYDDVIRNGRALLSRRPVDDLIPETERVIGESYFKKGEKEVARQYLESYLEHGIDSAEATALYALATILYDEGDTAGAARLFDRLTNDQNELAQSAWLYLGQCAVKDGDENAATMAFDRAYKLNYSRHVSELALYNYGTALMRGGTVPFSSSADVLEQFLRQYPRSEHASEVREMLGAAYCRQGEYGKALGYLDKISHPSEKVLKLRQQVLFQLGMEEQSTGRYADAETHLREAASLQRHDRAVGLQAQLWLGDALYAQKKYSAATKAYEAFLKGGDSTPNYPLGLYNLGYSLYYQDKFSQAVPYFTRAANASGLSASQRANARLRRADCLFYSRSYSDARKAYSDVISAGDPGADYATLRHATILGLQGDIPGKLKELEQLKSRYPQTGWDAAALLERASTLADAGRMPEAQTVYRELTDTYPEREETRRGLVSLAATYLRQGAESDAIEAYRRVISEWPSSEEAETSCRELANIYAASGGLQEYSAWLESIPGAPRLSVNEMERIAFNAADDAFIERGETRLLRQYVEQYPDGANLAKALYAIAEGEYDARDYDAALATLAELQRERPDAPQVNEALLLTGDILEHHSSAADSRARAYQAYRRLLERGNKGLEADALAGMMRTSSSPEEQIELAGRIVTAGAGSELMEQASYYSAMARITLGESAEGTSMLKDLAKNPDSLYGAMAAVALGKWQYDHKQYRNAEKTLTAFTESGTPHDYWLAKGFIVLADVYRAQGKESLATEYLTSLKENYPGNEADIIREIDKRLKKK